MNVRVRTAYCKNRKRYPLSPEARKQKNKCNRESRAKRNYGDLWEVAIFLFDLEKELNSTYIKRSYGIPQAKSAQARKRIWQRTLG